MLIVKVVSRQELNNVIENKQIPLTKPLKIKELLKEQVPNYREDIKPYISLLVNGKEATFNTVVTNDDELLIICEPGGVTATVVALVISAVVAIASVAYSMYMMHKVKGAASNTTKNGNTIYDVNAQGNKVKLQEVISENFGKFKKFPDYLTDTHKFYRNNQYFLDLVLSQGVGYYEHAPDYSDIYIANSPLSKIQGCQVRIYEPDTEINADNSVELGWHKGWYNSIEVTSSGKSVEPLKEEITNSDSATYYTNVINSDTLKTTKTTSNTWGAAGCAGFISSTVVITKPYVLPWNVDSYVKISNTPIVRQWLHDTNADNELSITEIGDNVIIKAKMNSLFYSSQWVRPCSNKDTYTTVVTNYDDTAAPISQTITTRVIIYSGTTVVSDTTAEETVEYDESRKDGTTKVTTLVSNGDVLRIVRTKKINLVVTLPSAGTSGPHTSTYSNSDNVSFDCEIIDKSIDDEFITFTVTKQQWQEEPTVEDPTIPTQHLNLNRNEYHITDIYQPIPTDYEFESDDGIYQLVSKDNDVMKFKRVTESYTDVSNWGGFWGVGLGSDVKFELDSKSTSTAGTWVGPYQANPIGVNATEYELDIVFPNGIGYINNDGGFDERTITLNIQYREVGTTEWTEVIKKWTKATNDEQAETLTFLLDSGIYEFRIKNETKADNDTRAMLDVKWSGLKCCVSDCNRYKDNTVIICRFKGSQTLSELSENQLWTLWTRKLPDIYTNELLPTREIAPVVKYICDNSKYKGIVNMSSLYEFDKFWKSKGFKCDGLLDSDNTLLECVKDTLNCGLSSLTVKDNSISFTRLKPSTNDDIIQLFTPQNLTASPNATMTFTREDSVNEVVVEYSDPKSYKTATLYLHLEEGELQVTTYPWSKYQEKVDLWGITQKDVAISIGARRLRYLTYTDTTYELKTELDGLNCNFNDLIGIVLDHNMSNITGRIVSYSDNVITVDREISKELKEGIVFIRKLDGSMLETWFTRITSRTLQVSEMIEWLPDYGTNLDYPYFAIGELVKAWVTDVSPSQKTCTIKAINYDERVFTNDL